MPVIMPWRKSWGSPNQMPILIRRGLEDAEARTLHQDCQAIGQKSRRTAAQCAKRQGSGTAKEYWTLALTAVEVMLHVPKSPQYIPRKVEAIGRELRQLESQTLTYEGAAASAEAVRLMETSERSVDALMERWNIWKKGEALYPSYLLGQSGRRGPWGQDSPAVGPDSRADATGSLSRRCGACHGRSAPGRYQNLLCVPGGVDPFTCLPTTGGRLSKSMAPHRISMLRCLMVKS